MRKVPKLTAEASDVRDAIELRRWYRAQAGLPKVAPMVFVLFALGSITAFASYIFPASVFPATDWTLDMRRSLEPVINSIGVVASAFLVIPGLFLLGFVSWKVIATVMYRWTFHKIATADANLRTPRAWYEFDGGKKIRKLRNDFSRII